MMYQCVPYSQAKPHLPPDMLDQFVTDLTCRECGQRVVAYKPTFERSRSAALFRGDEFLIMCGPCCDKHKPDAVIEHFDPEFDSKMRAHYASKN